mmetsp:Transcript_13088/g.30573  ORF Transcript_13088/g.30573 Transcript_13088/m.30573 type:complete len:213 (-) Transcript_13088:644-1282(-)
MKLKAELLPPCCNSGATETSCCSCGTKDVAAGAAGTAAAEAVTPCGVSTIGSTGNCGLTVKSPARSCSKSLPLLVAGFSSTTGELVTPCDTSAQPLASMSIRSAASNSMRFATGLAVCSVDFFKGPHLGGADPVSALRICISPASVRAGAGGISEGDSSTTASDIESRSLLTAGDGAGTASPPSPASIKFMLPLCLASSDVLCSERAGSIAS